jgi:3-deoxy-D-manno-octulosonic-acid transferase
MGTSYENFREIVGAMRAADGIRIVRDGAELRDAVIRMLTDREESRVMGARGRAVFEQQQGATAKTVAELLQLIEGDDGTSAAENVR